MNLRSLRPRAAPPPPEPTISSTGRADASPLTVALDEGFRAGAERRVKLPQIVVGMVGMSGQSYRRAINEIVRRTPDARYLEVGSWAGSTLCAAVAGNVVTAMAIDNWSEFGGPVAAFHANLSNVVSADAGVSVLNRDFRAVDYGGIGRFNIYLFDGPHARQDQYDGLALALPALEDRFIFIVDDWNWDYVRDGTLSAIRDLGLTEEFRIEVRTTLDNRHCNEHGQPGNQDSEWHNGYFLAVLTR